MVKLNYQILHDRFREQDNLAIAEALRQRAAASEDPVETDKVFPVNTEQLDQDEAA